MSSADPSSTAPARIGIAGLGGYAGAITDRVLREGAALDPPVEVAAVCDPDPSAHPERVAALRARGVQVLGDFEALLAADAIEGLWLPLPIELHRPYTERALAAGRPVLCEKPAAATVDDVDAMIAARDRAGLPAVVGFQNIYDPATLALKRRLLEGAIGPIRRASVRGAWPRSASYFERAAWAGRVRHGAGWVLDSPLQNAMSHFVNLALYLLGPGEAVSATPVHVAAELYRAAAIENYDTVAARVRLAEGPPLLVLLTHACARKREPLLQIEGARGRACWTPGAITLEAGGAPVRMTPDPGARERMLERFVRRVRGARAETAQAHAGGVASLEVARAHTLLVNGVSEAVPVRTVPAEYLELVDGVRAIGGIEAAFERCAAEFRLPHEAGALSFAAVPGARDLAGYDHFAGPA